MEVEDEFSEDALKQSSYRFLQKLAQSMALPSNVKKVYLIELIRAKKYRTKSEVEEIIQRVKAERLQMSKKRKGISKKTEKVNNKCPSPTTTSTPKRSDIKHYTIRPYDRETIVKYKPTHWSHNSINKTYSPSIAKTRSDRVLRSFCLKKVNSINNDREIASTHTHENIMIKKRPQKEIVKSGPPTINNMDPKSLIKRPKPSILIPKDFINRKSFQKQGDFHTVNYKEQTMPAKRSRTLSGIYPLLPQLQSFNKHICIEGLNFRQSDGNVLKIRALVQKRNNMDFELFNNDQQNTNTLHLNSCIRGITSKNDPISNVNNPQEIHLENENIEARGVMKSDFVDIDSYYYGYKQNELVNCNEIITGELEEKDKLPKIDEAFQMFKKRDLTQPLHIEISDNMEELNLSTNDSIDVSDNLCGSKKQCEAYEPLLQIATAVNSVGPAPEASTMARQTSTVDTVKSFIPVKTDLRYDNYNEEHTKERISELLKFSQILTAYGVRSESYNTSSLSPVDTLQNSDVYASIDEMVDDALTIISQDGDYMQQIESDISVQCVICSWAGSQFSLQNHVKTEHPNNIFPMYYNECNIKFVLGHLVHSDIWHSQVIEHDSDLYALCIKYADPDCLMATISTLCTNPKKCYMGKITIYNKVTGEPYTWEGPIKTLSPCIPHYNDADGLKLKLSALNLIPNSANLKLVNRELVNDTPTKVVVGQPEFNDIDITLSITID